MVWHIFYATGLHLQVVHSSTISCLSIMQIFVKARIYLNALSHEPTNVKYIDDFWLKFLAIINE